MASDDANFDAELRTLLTEGRKIEAIKRYREETGAGLAEAKDAIEALERGQPLATSEPVDTSLETEIVSLLEQGRKIQAVKVYRERTGTSLKEAKDAVEAIGRGEKVVAAFGEIDQEVESQLIGLLQQDQKIQAVKLCHSQTGMGLKEAKDTVEALAEKHGLSVATGGGCLGAVILVLLLIVAGVGLSNEPQLATKTYTNPVGDAPIHMGDPFVIQHDGRYYLFGTNAPNEGFRCLVSTDLVHWKQKGWAYREMPDSWAKSHYWAPEVKQYRGKFYMTYSAMNKASSPPRLLIALAVSDRPEGPYQDLHAPWFDFGYSAIDGHIFVDDDGKPYLYFSRNGSQDGYSFGIMYVVALADDLSKPVGEPVKLMEADQPWEKVRYAENRCNEGAFVLKHEGRYYMTYSANHTGFPHYGIGYATATQPLGPWVKAEENPIAATDLEVGVSGPGHSCITRSPDGRQMFIIYHTHADAEKPSGDRVVNIDRIGFDESGKLKITGPTRTSQPMPSGCK